MSDPPRPPAPDPGLNPALRQRTEEVHDTRQSTPPPAESASVQHEEGRHWPMVWAAVTIIGVLIGLWLIFF
jgi:hypothetical protein